MIINNSKTIYENMHYNAEDLEHWDGEGHYFDDFNSKLEFDNGLFYEFFMDEIVSDGLSIPTQFRDRIERYGWYLLAGLEHDGHYAGEVFDRKLCDEIFFAKMEFKDLNRKNWFSRSIGWTLRNAAYYAVRIGGKYVWQKHNKKDVKLFRKMIWLKITSCPDDLLDKIIKYEDNMIKQGYPSVILYDFKNKG